MDLNDLRIAVTLASLLLFLVIVGWALARSNRKRFDDASRLPFEGEARDE